MATNTHTPPARLNRAAERLDALPLVDGVDIVGGASPRLRVTAVGDSVPPAVLRTVAAVDCGVTAAQQRPSGEFGTITQATIAPVA